MRHIHLVLWFSAVLGTLIPVLSIAQGLAASGAPEPTLAPATEERRPLAAPEAIEEYRRYREIITRTMGMRSDPEAQRLAQQAGLNIVDVTWEDTGRYQNSAVGPNISDMTIQVQQQDPATRRHHLNLMPVIRHPNFADLTADVRLDQFFLLVGNERGEELRRVSLRDFLGNLRRYLNEPSSWAGRRNSLLAPRDSHVLVSAQACFLPVPQGGMAQFNPVLFNYQSYAGDPAVLTILATREGTSVTVIDNQRDGFEAGATWGQRLFFNQNGERASLTGQRLSDFVVGDRAPAAQSPTPTATPTAVEESGLNMVLLIQVPLKQRQPMQFGLADSEAMGAAPPTAAAMERSNVEAAVIGHGAVEGPFTEIDGLPIERDTRFPIRVTVQFYKATSNGVVSAQDIQDIQQQIARVYEDADYVGSLVVDQRRDRPTDYEGSHEEPPNWWQEFWQRHQTNTGQTRRDVWNLFRWLRNER